MKNYSASNPASLQDQKRDLECYVGRIVTLFSQLDELLEWLLRCLISEDSSIGALVLETGFAAFSRRFELLKNLVRLKHGNSEELRKLIQRIGESDAIRTTAAHAYIPVINPGSAEAHMALYDPSSTGLSEKVEPAEMHKNVEILIETNNLLLKTLNDCLAKKKARPK